MGVIRLVVLLSLVGCGSGSGILRGQQTGGYCFKASGVSKFRCFEKEEQCLRRESIAKDQHPWMQIEVECRKQ